MELRHLRHFAAVVECGNLSRAAEQVFISQPALTRSIKSLEDSVGAVLLERRPRGVVPTPAGEALHRYARLMLNEAANARAEVAAVQSGARGQLSVGIAAMFADHIVDRAVMRLCTAADVSIQVTQGFIEELVEALRDGRLDLLFTNLGTGALPGDVHVEPLIDINAFAYVGATHPLTRLTRITKEDLISARWAVADHPRMHEFLDQYFSVDGLPTPVRVVRTNSLDLIRSLLASGGFVGIVPEHLVAASVARGEIVRIDAPDCPVARKAGLITRAGRPPQPLLDQFVAELRAACRDAPTASHAAPLELAFMGSAV